MILIITSLIIFILTIIYIGIIKIKYQHWTNLGVHQIKPTLPFGNIGPVLRGKISLGEQTGLWYKEFKNKNLKYGGVYNFISPVFVAIHPEVIKQIVVTDFDSFNSHETVIPEGVDPFVENFFGFKGDKWRKTRSKFNPIFSSKKLKMMVDIMVKCSDKLVEVLEEFSKSSEPLEIKEICARYTTDVISNCAFGLECDSLKNPNTKFRMCGKAALDTDIKRVITLVLILILPKNVSKLLRLKVMPMKVQTFVSKTVKDSLRYREENNIIRNDFLHMLLQLKNKGKLNDDDDFENKEAGESYLTVQEIIANSFLFFMAGYETSAITITFALYEIANNPNIQEKIRSEINEIIEKYDGHLTYDAIHEMKYLDNVLNETLRMHPPNPTLSREVTKDCKIIGSNLILKKGMKIGIPIQAIQMDPNNFENPEKFDPERFSNENKFKIKPYTYLPFGDGPRICIGLKFGLLQSKIALIAILRNFNVSFNQKTILPIQTDPASFTMKNIKGGLWLNVEKIL